MTQITTITRGRHMDYSNLPTILAAVTTLLGSFGLGAKWLLNRMDRQDAKEREWQTAERNKLEALFAVQIENLRSQITDQSTEIHRLRSDLTSYVRHVGVLEGMLKANGIEAPPFVKAIL